jgi:hypothetical protein
MERRARDALATAAAMARRRAAVTSTQRGRDDARERAVPPRGRRARHRAVRTASTSRLDVEFRAVAIAVGQSLRANDELNEE